MRKSLMPFAWTLGALALMSSLIACSNNARDAGIAAIDPASAPANRSGEGSPARPAAASPAVVSPAGANVPQASATHGKIVVDASGSAPAEQAANREALSRFDPKHPSLAGITLGMDEKEVLRKLGEPSQKYDLPEEENVVHMHEYDGLSVGFGAKNRVVYVEIAKAGVDTGLEGIQIGTEGREAAAALGDDFASDTQVLSRDVARGMVKVDLDPATRTVLSVKLIGQD
jgi:hypothetical protein